MSAGGGVNAVTGRVAVGISAHLVEVAALVSLVAEVEEQAGTAEETLEQARRAPQRP